MRYFPVFTTPTTSIAIATVSTDKDAFADRALARPKHLGHPLVHDDDALSLWLISIVKVAAFENRNLHRVEVSRS